jgi:regulation of enolase protein 1 (concanavalin A-like superfamily)
LAICCSLEKFLGVNEPENWNIESGKLVISPEKTDFWSKTHYGFTYDNGHCLFRHTSGDFILSTRVNFFPKHKYDQAGLMVRISKDFWLKTSIEYENETLSRLGVVVTNFGFSDWSTQDFNPRIQEIELKVEKNGMDYIVAFGTSMQAAIFQQYGNCIIKYKNLSQIYSLDYPK